MINNNEFDQFLKDKFDAETITPKKSWKEFQQKLAPQSPKIIPFYQKTVFKWSGVAAACIILAGTYLAVQPEKEVHIVSNTPITHTPDTATNNVNVATTNTEAIAQPNTILPTPISNNSLAYRTNNTSQSTTIVKQTENVAAKPSIDDNITAEIVVKEAKQAPINQFEALQQLNQYYNTTATQQTSLTQRNKQQLGSLGISTGLTTGKNQNGLNIALNGVYNLNENVFIEGTLAYQNNNPNDVMHSTKIINQDIDMSNAMGKPQAFASPAISKDLEELHYVQFNPSVGYKFNDVISVSFGADVQNLVNQKNTEILTYNKELNTVEKIAKTDLGLTTKTEFKITKNLKTGLTVRNGINNLFKKNDGLNYVNRQYIQLQFRYNINLIKKNTVANYE